MMPPTSRLLYYDLGMNADDDGFCEHFTIMKMTDATPDDLRVLQARGLVKVFDDKVLIIRDWKENNYLQKDRYTPSKYLEIFKEELKQLSSGKQNVIPNDNQMDKKCIQDVNTGKVRKDKVSKGNINSDLPKSPLKRKDFKVSTDDYKKITDAYEKYKDIKLQGAEFGEVKRAIKTMIYSGRTKENIIDFMKWISEICETMQEDENLEKQYCWLKNWTILTIKRKMPEFLAGKFQQNDDIETPEYAKSWAK